MAVPFTVVGIDHVVLRAADPTKLDRFYLDALGLTFEKRQGELAQLRAGNALIDIVPADEAGPAGGTSSAGGANLDHLCLRMRGYLPHSTGRQQPGRYPLRPGLGPKSDDPSRQRALPGVSQRVHRREYHRAATGELRLELPPLERLLVQMS